MGKDLKGKELGKGLSQRADGRYIARFTSKTGKRKTLYDFKLNELKRKLREAVYEDEHWCGIKKVDSLFSRIS